MPRNTFRALFTSTFVGGFALLIPAISSADTGKIKTLLARAEVHEKAYEWGKAYTAYDDALRINRDTPGVKDRQTTVLRRYWQEQRHADPSYRKEILSLDYAQALRLNSTVFDTLLENSLPKTKLTAGTVLKKGIEELETALCDPRFLANHLVAAKPASVNAFRDFLAAKKKEAGRLSRGDCGKALREIALAAQSSLELSPTVALMEMACGSCYAIDEYTAYLTPNQFRELNDALKTGAMVFTPSVQYALKTMDVGYLQITQFQETTPQEVEEAFFALNKSNIKGLILDLRGNPGGLVESSVEVARRFLTSGVIASTVNFDPKLSTVYHARNASAWTVPVVILVDADTASAAEVLAGALKDNNRARVLGQPTFGKGSSQGLVKLPDAMGNMPTGGLRLTIARFFSPKGMPYAGQGVTPDLILEAFKPEGMDVVDPHITAAIDDLQRQLALK